MKICFSGKTYKILFVLLAPTQPIFMVQILVNNKDDNIHINNNHKRNKNRKLLNFNLKYYYYLMQIFIPCFVQSDYRVQIYRSALVIK